jgi:hypothetical protein
MPCPRGQNPETFRLYEALEHGAIPILIGEPNDTTFVQMVTANIPVPVFENWSTAVAFAQTLLQNPITLAEYHTMMLSKWSVWKKKLAEQCTMYLKLT